MASSTPEHRYHVVGIRIDGSHSITGSGLSMAEARRVRDALAEARIFSAIKIKPDPRPLAADA